MKIGFNRNVEDVELFGSKYKIASRTIADAVKLDLLKFPEGTTQEHQNVEKMIIAISDSLSINYTTIKFDVFHFYNYFKIKKLKKELSPESLLHKLTFAEITELSYLVNKLDEIDIDAIKKKVKEK